MNEWADFAKMLPSLGVGGALAGVLLFFYRKDVRQYTELWKNQSEQLMMVVKENTHTQTRLVDVIEHLCDRMDRVEGARNVVSNSRELHDPDRRRA